MEKVILALIIIGLSAGLIRLYLKLLKTKKDKKQVEDLYRPISDAKSEVEKHHLEKRKIVAETKQLSHKYAEAKKIYMGLKLKMKIYEDDLELLEYGVYKPHFDFETSAAYKEKLLENKNRQKELIQIGKAAICRTNWSVGNSQKKGEMMTKRSIKLTLRAFNGECDALIAKVKWNNVTQTEQRIKRAFEAINKVNKSNDINIEGAYLKLKIDETRLTHELAQKKYEEKEEQRQIREQMREEERALREIEKAQKEAALEEERYEKALEKAQKEVKEAKGKELEKLNELIAKLKLELEETHDAKERAISRAQMTKSGHVYIISNIGSFGEHIYKIGMTRRLEPLDRVKELGDASVPFQFDIHAMIYSENAPELESSLHRTFNKKRVNMVNLRKEYFNVPLREIEKVVKERHDAEIEFTMLAEAKEYRETLSKRKNKQAKEETPQEMIEAEFPEKI